MELYFEIMYSYKSSKIILLNVLMTLAVLVAAYAIVRILRYYLFRKLTDNRKAQLIYRLTFNVIGLLSLVAMSMIWFSGRQGPVIIFGLVLAVIILATKDLVINIAGWFYVTMFSIYEIGDRIEIDGIIGNVSEVSLLHTRLSEVKGKLLHKHDTTGRDVFIPNHHIFEKVFYNYSNDSKFMWADAVMHIDMHADYRKALRLTEAIAHEATVTAQERYSEEDWEIFENVLETNDKEAKATVRMQFDPQAIGIYLTYFCQLHEIGERREYDQLKMFEAFRENDIELGDVKAIFVENL